MSSRSRVSVSARVLCSATLLLAGSAMAAKNWYVAPWGDDNNDGTSWATAMKSPELAADKIVDNNGNTLIISNGTYKLTKAISVLNRPNVRIKSLTGDPKDVVLDGQGQCRGIYLWEGYTGGISGVTVTNCVTADASGAGIATRYAYIKITDCIVRDCHIRVNSQKQIGGAGIYAMWATVAGCTVEDCTITNVAGAAGKTVFGGGIHGYRTMVTNCVVRRCAIRMNSGECYPTGAGINLTDGGEVPTSDMPIPTIIDTEISACKVSLPYASGGEGSGLFISSTAPDDDAGNPRQAIVRNCLISSCTNWRYGPLTAKHADIVNTTVTNCVDTYTGVDSHRGIGLWMVERCRARGCLITGNTGTQGHNYNGGTPAVRMGGDCTFVDSAVIGNCAAARVALVPGANCLVSNCLFRANSKNMTCTTGLVYVPDLAAGSQSKIVDSYFVENDMSQCSWAAWAFFANGNANAYEVLFRNCLFANNKTGGGAFSVYSTNPGSQLRAVLENCTLTHNENNGSYSMVHGYYEKTDAQGVASSHVSPFRMFVRGCVVAENTGDAYKDGIEYQIYSFTNNVNYSVFPLSYTRAINPAAVGDKVYDPSKPLFRDAAAQDYRQAVNSQACDMVPPSDWMGTGKKNGPQDLGSGCEMDKVEDYGVTIKRINTSRRLSGTMADAGCTELYRPRGLIITVR